MGKVLNLLFGKISANPALYALEYKKVVKTARVSGR